MRTSVLVAVAVLAVAVSVRAGNVTVVSVSSAGVEGNGAADGFPSISGDGRFVVFTSSASNLVPGDTNGVADVFLRDTLKGSTTRVSVGPGGVQADGASVDAFISADGRWVQYTSHATNLVPGDTNGVTDGFVYDRVNGTTARVTLGVGGVQGNGESELPVLSADGRFVAFDSTASNLVPGDTNGVLDVFVRDLQLGTTTRVSVGPGGVEGNGGSFVPDMAAGGRYVVFLSDASNLVPGDTNGTTDIFRRDLQTGVTERVSVATGGAQSLGLSDSESWANVSPDGRFITFDNDGDDLTPGDTNGQDDSYLRDMLLGTTTLVSVPAAGGQADNASFNESPSANGRFVVFTSFASNMVPGDGNGVVDIFVRDTVAHTTRRLSVSSTGAEGDGKSNTAQATPDGRHVVYQSEASNLVPGDGNGAPDIFVFSDTWVQFQTFGEGLAGSGGFVPELEGTPGPAVAGGYALHLEDVLGAAKGTLFVGLGESDAPAFGGHFYPDLGAPNVGIALGVAGLPGFPGSGTLDLPGADASPLLGTTLVLQFLAADAAAPKGVSMSNGLRLTVEN